MADQTFKASDQSVAKSLADQAMSTGRELRDKAADMAADLAGSSSEAIREQASNFVDAAKDVASQTTDRIKEKVDDQKHAGADYVGNLADTMRRAAREFDADLPIAGVYIRKAAAQVEGVSDSIKMGNLDDLFRNARSFARRQPTAFLGIAVLAGFGVVRFLKSSSHSSEGVGETAANRSAANNRGYRNEFSK